MTASRIIDSRGLLTLRGAKISAEQAQLLAAGIASEASLIVVS